MQDLTHLPLAIHPDIIQARELGLPIVALETAVVTHGLPYPDNLKLACEVEDEIRNLNAVPAAIGLLHGKVVIGLTKMELEELATTKDARKVSRKDFAIIIAAKGSGGTTVAGTMIAAHLAGLRVFSTGGIGGVHRNSHYDVSADLNELSKNQMIVVCSGAKAILDMPATFEMLETLGVPVLGYQTNMVPAFYSLSSSIPVTQRLESAEEIVSVAQTQWKIGLEGSILVVNPPPQEIALPIEMVELEIQKVLQNAKKDHISGPAVTPYLLNNMNELTGGQSMRTNLALLKNNARLAANIARQLSSDSKLKTI